MIGEVDKDGDREISYTEFANLMKGFGGLPMLDDKGKKEEEEKSNDDKKAENNGEIKEVPAEMEEEKQEV